MKISLLTQPHDIFSEDIEQYFIEKGHDHKMFCLDIDITTEAAEVLFVRVLGTPICYIDGRYVADPIGYLEGTFDPDDPSLEDWSQQRLSDSVVVITVPNCRGCKHAKEWLAEKEVIYRELPVDDDVGPNNAFCGAFFTAHESQMDFPIVIINGDNRRDWKEYFESDRYKK
jgi:glutaredoxin